jgi:hypothetical protein
MIDKDKIIIYAIAIGSVFAMLVMRFIAKINGA